MLTQERLKELLDYDPETGVFVWKISEGRRKAGEVAGTPHSKGYIQINTDGKMYLAHRLAWMYMYGCWPDKEIDHINRAKTDNRIKNLRDTDKNNWNVGKRKDNTSGYQGVHWNKRVKKWAVYIRVLGKRLHLGYFDTPEAANAAYVAAKEKLHIID